MRVLLIFLYCGTITLLSAQTVPNVLTFFCARDYDRYQGEVRIEKVRALERNNWYVSDTMYGQAKLRGRDPDNIIRHDLAPFVDEDGETEYLVADVMPVFSGGRKALERHLSNAMHSYVTRYDADRGSVYMRCTIDTSGSIIHVMEAQRHHDVSVNLLQACVDAVQYMPNWSPAIFKGKPVRACIMIDIGFQL